MRQRGGRRPEARDDDDEGGWRSGHCGEIRHVCTGRKWRGLDGCCGPRGAALRDSVHLTVRGPGVDERRVHVVNRRDGTGDARQRDVRRPTSCPLRPVEVDLVRPERQVARVGGVSSHRRVEQAGSGDAGPHRCPASEFAPLRRSLRAVAVVGADAIDGRHLIDHAESAVAVVRVIEDRAVPILLGAVVLRAAEHDDIRCGMLIDELELRDGQSLVNAVAPRGATIARAIDATIGSGVEHEVIGRIECQRVIVWMERAADVGERPHTRSGIPHAFPQRDSAEKDDVGCGGIDSHVEVVETLTADTVAGTAWKRDSRPRRAAVGRSIQLVDGVSEGRARRGRRRIVVRQERVQRLRRRGEIARATRVNPFGDAAPAAGSPPAS